MGNINIDLLILIVVIALVLVVFLYMEADLIRQCIRKNRSEKRGGEKRYSSVGAVPTDRHTGKDAPSRYSIAGDEADDDG